jgi:hypothetical protein
MIESSDRTVTVIIPTLALAERAEHIRRAIDSVLRQKDVHAIPLVVVNGPWTDQSVVRGLRLRSDIRLTELPDASLPAALAAGRRLVATRWFAELDDDDLLLPEALTSRLRLLECDRALDAVVSNGIVRGTNGDEPAIGDVERVASDPLAALGEATWLSPGSALFRTASVPAEFFDAVPQYLEWTYLAVRLAQSYQLAFLPEATFVHHLGTPHGIWGSTACTLGIPPALQRVLGLDLPSALRSTFAERLGEAWHQAAATHLRDGRVRAALDSHWRCLNSARGWRYLPFTGKLLVGLVTAPALGT